MSSPLRNSRGGVSSLVAPRLRSCNEPPEILRRLREEKIILFDEEVKTTEHILLILPDTSTVFLNWIYSEEGVFDDL